MKDREYTKSWTAISHPPYLTALALWPKGDCWHGGGLFEDKKTVWLNHKPDAAQPHPNHRPKVLKVVANPTAHGEDDPIYSMRLARDGWECVREWKYENRGYPRMFETLQPEIRDKPLRGRPWIKLRLRRSISQLDYREEFALLDKETGAEMPLAGASWADWDRRGRLVFARDGKILAAQVKAIEKLTEGELINLNSEKPTAVEAPYWAKKW